MILMVSSFYRYVYVACTWNMLMITTRYVPISVLRVKEAFGLFNLAMCVWVSVQRKCSPLPFSLSECKIIITVKIFSGFTVTILFLFLNEGNCLVLSLQSRILRMCSFGVKQETLFQLPLSFSLLPIYASLSPLSFSLFIFLCFSILVSFL